LKIKKLIPYYFVGFVVILFALACILPLILVIIVSFTAESEIIRQGFSFFPRVLSLDAYRILFRNGTDVFRSYGITIFITVAGTCTAVVITMMIAYTLSNPSVYYRNSLAMFFFVTMVFNGGMVPWYIICRKIGLMNNIFALIIPSLVFNPFNMFLARNYMRGIPVSLMESAKLDGANDAVIAFRIYFPLSLPILATVALFYAIAYWNDWWNAIMLITDARLYPMQYFLIKLRSELTMLRNLQGGGIGRMGFVPSNSLQMATAVLTIGPVILFYPYLQKYIVKGLVVGSIKG
jgi:putative aldouronate transport system permease protein